MRLYNRHMIIKSGEYHDYIEERLFYAAYGAARHGIVFSVEIEFNHHPALDPLGYGAEEEWGDPWYNLEDVFYNLDGYLETDNSVFLEFITEAYPAYSLPIARSIFQDVAHTCESLEQYEDGLVSSNGTHINFMTIAKSDDDKARIQDAVSKFSKVVLNTYRNSDDDYKTVFRHLFGRWFNKYAFPCDDALIKYAWLHIQSKSIEQIINGAREYIDDFDYIWEEDYYILEEYIEEGSLVRLEWRLASFSSYEQFMHLQKTLWKVSRHLFQGDVDSAIDALNNALEEAKVILKEEATV